MFMAIPTGKVKKRRRDDPRPWTSAKDRRLEDRRWISPVLRLNREEPNR
jgi:hypothetical protein